MRQQLPESAGESLYVNDISRIVSPGEEFDAPGLVPGCVEVADPAGDDAQGDDKGGEAKQDQPAAKNRARSKGE